MSAVTLLAVSGLAGFAAAWLTVILLLASPRLRIAGRTLRLEGPLVAASPQFAVFAATCLLPTVPAPRQLFEQLGPDRFRREFLRSLRMRSDAHVDELMSRRNAKAWEGLSNYARQRVYAHFHRRIPYAIDDFVDSLQRDIDEIVIPGALVRQWFVHHPGEVRAAFLEACGSDLRSRLPLAGALSAILCTVIAPLLPAVAFWPGFVALSALSGSVLVLAMLAYPHRLVELWPMALQGVIPHANPRFVRALARRIAAGPLAWESVLGELAQGTHSGRFRQIVRRQMSTILDTTLFKVTLQLLLGPEAMVGVKQSAVEKSLELLADTPVSPGLREAYRAEVERSLLHAAAQVESGEYRALWRPVMLRAWQWLPLSTFLAGAVAGWILGGLLAVVG